MLRTAEEAKMRLPLQRKVVNSCFFSKIVPDYLMKGAYIAALDGSIAYPEVLVAAPSRSATHSLVVGPRLQSALPLAANRVRGQVSTL
jgi:hypothetical protein